MPSSSDIRWFNETFGSRITTEIRNTPFDLPQIISIACQETGYIWSVLRRKNLSEDNILALCVGDTIDYKGPKKGRQAFPHDKAQLVSRSQGKQMFDIAREALVEMSKYVPGYEAAASNPDKFCHGFGVFQRDLQFFEVDPNYFLGRKYENFENTLDHCIKELSNAVSNLRLDGSRKVSDADFCKAAICYNTGWYRPEKGLKQGHFNDGKYYGELIADYLVQIRDALRSSPIELPRRIDIGPYIVNARSGLKLRAGPGVGFIAHRTLPFGTELAVVAADEKAPDWALVDLEGDGIIDGCVLGSFLRPSPFIDSELVPEPD
jgi:hypothetical protein